MPDALAGYALATEDEGLTLVYRFETEGERSRITTLLRDLNQHGLTFKDLETRRARSKTSSCRWGGRQHEPACGPRIYRFEMARTFRTLVQSILAPVLTTSLYFVVFGAAIGSRMTEIGGVPYGAFIVRVSSCCRS